MLKRIRSICLAVIVFCALAAMPVSAATEHPLLSEEKTAFPNGGSYTEDGTLLLQSGGDRAVAVIEWAQEIELQKTPYLQLALESSAPFNVALKLRSGSSVSFAQLTGPSWYEAFQETPPTSDGGVVPGTYAISLDIKNYMEYNGCSFPQNGKLTLESVYITLCSQGELKVSHLTVSNKAEFVTADNKNSTVVSTMAPIIQDTASSRVPGGSGGSYDAAAFGGSYSPDADVSGAVWLILIGVLAIGTVIVLAVVRRRMGNENDEDETEEAEQTEETEGNGSEETE